MPSPKKPFLRLRMRTHGLHEDAGSSTSRESNEGIGGRAGSWRQQLKKRSPQQYEALKKHDAAAARLRRLEQKEELEKPENAELKKIKQAKKAQYMKEFRARKKLEKENERERRNKGEKKKKLLKTRADAEKERAFKDKDAARKRRERAALPKKVKKAILKKRREKAKEEKERIAMLVQKQQQLREETLKEKERLRKEAERLLGEWEELNQAKKSHSSPAKRKRLSRARRSISNNPIVFAETISDLVEKASPRKKKILERSTSMVKPNWTSHVTDAIAGTMTRIHKSRKKKDVQLKRTIASSISVCKKYRVTSKICKSFKMSPKTLKEKKTSIHKRKVTPDVKAAVQASYERHSITLPDKRFVSRKTGKPSGFLTVPISNVYEDFKTQNPNIKMGLSKFCAMRPHHIKRRSAVKYRGCLCEYCANMELKISALNSLSHRHNIRSPFSNVYSINRATLCDKGSSKYYNLACIERKCLNCGVTNIFKTLEDLTAVVGEHEIIWKKWERDPETKKMVLVSKQTDIAELVSDMEYDAVPFAQHLFTASWQSTQYSHISKNVPKDTVVMVYDFAENYACRYQDEVQSVHWGHEAATLHPIVANYRCQTCDDLVTHSLVMVSNDNSHDHHAVNTFTISAMQYLKGVMDIRQVIRFSDGAPCQYKSKGPFLDISHAKSDFGSEFQHEFFGSRHGKGPSDGESGVLKRMATDAVMAGTAVIRNAKDFFEFLTLKATRPAAENQCAHFQRTIFWIDTSSIDRERRQARKTVEGTRQIHSVVSVSPGVIRVRNLSCFCAGCVGREGDCQNRTHVKPYNHRSINTGAIVSTPRAAMTTPRVAVTTSAAMTTPRVAMTTPSATMTTPIAAVTSPNTTETRSSTRKSLNTEVAMTTPSAAMTSPSAAVTTPCAAVTTPSAAVTTPSAAVTTPSAAVTTPSTSVTTPSEAITAPNAAETKLSNDMYVAVKFECRPKDVIYLAMILNVDEGVGEVTLAFLRRDASGHYTFSKEEHHIHPLTDICKIMTSPEVIKIGRSLKYQFKEHELADLEKNGTFLMK